MLETFYDSTVPLNDKRQYIKGYLMITVDHPSNIKRGGVRIYHKEHLFTAY